MGPRLILEHQVFLLAAGHGRRAGGPKAWRELQGAPAIAAQLQSLAWVVRTPRIFASIQAEWLSLCRHLSAETNWIAVDPDLPPLASLQALIAAADPARPAFVYHVDMGPFEPAVFSALEPGTAEAATPLYGGRRGHPVLLAPALFGPIAALDPGKDRLDAFLRTRRVAEIAVGSPEVLGNRNY